MSPVDSAEPMFESNLRSLKKIHQGKVRDIYEVDEGHLLIVTTDRLSAFDVIMREPIPHKGEVLTRISRFWFERTRHIIPNHLTSRRVEEVVQDPDEQARLRGRSMIVRKLHALPVEAVVRGYLIGSGWKDYQRNGSLCGIALPAGLALAQALPRPLFTPASKAPAGQHDENIDFASVEQTVGAGVAAAMRDAALALYGFASGHARERGIIIADTKFEFGLDAAGTLTLIDEALTPDSSRFWPVESYKPGISPPSFDKQFVRDYLESLDWDKRPPPPPLPAEVIRRTSENYLEGLRRLTQ
ncbi:MAG: phosphoribosylaminoimidazolesuccinocarboxamide synthase [Proteobacteria bacterium]|nr:phosphoribosylaminoimidazolesuccinocarboxamide synthase [Pseudomonadota bacterium]